MKKNLVRNLIIFIIWCLIITGILVTYFNFKTVKSTQISNSNSIVTLSLNQADYNAGDEVIVTVKTNEIATAISFYLNYDSKILSFKTTDDGISIKDYPDQNLVRVIYFDIENKGRDTFNFKFKANKANNNSEIYLTNTAISTISNNSYLQKDDEIKIGIQNDKDLTNTKNIIMISLIVAAVLDTIILVVSLIKSKGAKNGKENNN